MAMVALWLEGSPLQQTRNVLLECMWGDTFTFGDVSYALSHCNLQSLTPPTPARSSHLKIGNLPDHSSGPRESICGRVAAVWRHNHGLSSGPSPSNSVQVTFPETRMPDTVLISQQGLAKCDVKHVPLAINSWASFPSKLALYQADPAAG